MSNQPIPPTPESPQTTRDKGLDDAACSRETIERLEASNEILTTLLHFPLAPSCEVSPAEIEACVSSNRMEIERLKYLSENVKGEAPPPWSAGAKTQKGN